MYSPVLRCALSCALNPHLLYLRPVAPCSRSVLVLLIGLRLGATALFVVGLTKPLARYNPIVLGFHFVPIAWYLVALLWLGPEIWDREAIIEICSEVVHDAYGEHDVNAKLMVSEEITVS